MQWLPILLVAIFLVAPFSSAEAAPQYTVTPRLIDETLEARDIVNHTITVTNNDSGPVRVFAVVNEIDLDAGGEIQRFVPPSMSDRTQSITSWIRIPRSQKEINPGETIELPLTIQLPPEVQPGEYHAFIGLGWGTNQVVAKRTVENGTAPGVILSISVDKNEEAYVRLGGFQVQRFIGGGEGELSYELINPSKLPVVPRGEVIFYDARGMEIASIPVNTDGSVVPPGERMTFNDIIPASDLLGRYKAFLTVEFGESQVASVQDTEFFYSMPWYIMLLIIGGLLLAVLLIAVWLYRHEYDEEDADDVPLFVRNVHDRDDQEHDIRLPINRA